MSPVQTNTQVGLITKPAPSDLSGSIGCFATVNASAQATLPTSHGLALYVIEDAYDSTGGVHNTVLRPLDGERNIRVIAAATIPCAANVTTDGAGKAVPASSGNNILAISEEFGAIGQYVLLRPLGGIQTA